MSSPAPSELTWTQSLTLGLTPRAYLRRLVTPFNAVAFLILAVGLPLIVYRFSAGIGAVSNLSQTNPWGLWIGLDVASGVALAAGGYTIACAVYIFGLDKYHPIVRPAVLTAFLGYLFVIIGLAMDLGRPWKLPVPIVYSWGVTSVLFEVGWCVLLYAAVLGMEFSPAVFEWLGWKRARAWAANLIVALTVIGVVLSTLHQSSLGSLFLIAKSKLHPLWYSPFIPVLFFVSSIIAGVSMVICESTLSHRAFADQHDPKRPLDLDGLCLGLGKAGAVVLFAYFFGRLIVLADSGAWIHLNTGWGAWWAVEVLGFVALPCALYAVGVRHRRVRWVRAAAVLAVLGIVLNRFNVSFIAFRWDQPDRYIPNWMEWVVSLTIITLGVLVFRWVVNRLPVLRPHADYVSSSHGS